jgi:hypothetical protein
VFQSFKDVGFFRAKEMKEKQQRKRKLKQQGKRKLKYQEHTWEHTSHTSEHGCVLTFLLLSFAHIGALEHTCILLLI